MALEPQTKNLYQSSTDNYGDGLLHHHSKSCSFFGTLRDGTFEAPQKSYNFY